jgi:low temperature requirement protein LtrA
VPRGTTAGGLMTAGGPERLLRAPEDPRRASYLELFFDLAFVFALTQLTRSLARNLDLGGGLHTLLLLAALWWVWVIAAWLTDWFDPGTRAVQGLLGLMMFGGLLMAAAVPEAFGAHAALFAGTYVAVHLGRGLVLLSALRGHPLQRRSARAAFWFVITGVLWTAGAVIPPARLPLWAVAVIVDYAIAWFGWPTPKLGRTERNDLRTTGSHLSERLQQIFIISVGDLVLVAGISYSDAGLGWAQTAAFALSFVNAALIALIYYLPAGKRLGPAIDESEYPASLGQEAVFLHLILIAGVVASAVGTELLIVNADRQASLPVVVVTVAGTALFLVGRLVLSVVIYHRLSRPRLIGLLAIIALTPAVFHLPSLGVIAVADAVLLATAASDYFVERHGPPSTAQ